MCKSKVDVCERRVLEAAAALDLPKEVPLEVEEELAQDPAVKGSAMEMVDEGDVQQAMANMSNPA